MEDLLEELVGEIFDELDDPRQTIPSLGPGILVVDAAHPLAELAERFGVTLESPPRTATAGGYVIWKAGRIPQAGERVASGGLEFDVLEATPTRLVRLVVRRAGEARPERPAGGWTE
jgi:putative hemolysin